jgi:uncharacterized membrane protein YhhN
VRVRITSSGLKGAYGALAIADAWLAGRPQPLAHRARTLTKPLLMPTLAGSLLLDERARRSPLRTSTLLAQAAGWVGDLALMRDGRGAFMAGAGAFAIGHGAYITGFRGVGRPMSDLGVAIGPRVVGAAWLLSAPVLAGAAAREDRRLGGAVLGYSAVLAAMAAAAQHLGSGLPRSARVLTGVGAATFLVSDTALGAREFLLREPDPRLESLVMATYTTAQLLIAEGAARA